MLSFRSSPARLTEDFVSAPSAFGIRAASNFRIRVLSASLTDQVPKFAANPLAGRYIDGWIRDGDAGVVAVVETLKGHPLFAHVTLTRSERLRGLLSLRSLGLA